MKNKTIDSFFKKKTTKVEKPKKKITNVIESSDDETPVKVKSKSKKFLDSDESENENPKATTADDFFNTFSLKKPVKTKKKLQETDLNIIEKPVSKPKKKKSPKPDKENKKPEKRPAETAPIELISTNESETAPPAAKKVKKSPKEKPKTTPKAKKSSKKEDPPLTPEQQEEKKKKARQLYHQFQNRAGPQEIGSIDIPNGPADALKDKLFCLSGVLEFITKEDFQDFICRHGGIWKTSVTKKCDYLVKGRDFGQTKVNAAEKNKFTKVITGEDVVEMVKKKIKKEEDKPVKTPLTPVRSNLQNLNIESESMQMSEEPKPEKASKMPPKVSKERITLTEKYKPFELSKIIGQNGAASPANKLHAWLKSWEVVMKSVDYKHATSRPGFNGSNDGKGLKAALLSGPPGIGKSTSAALVAQDLGFNIVEYNASSVRNKKLLKEKLGAEVSSTKISDKKYETSSKSVLIRVRSKSKSTCNLQVELA